MYSTDKFASWQFGQLDFIDPIENLQDSVRTVFPLLYNAELVSFQLDKNDNDSKLIDIDAVLVIFINGVLQEPKEHTSLMVDHQYNSLKHQNQKIKFLYSSTMEQEKLIV